MEEVQVELLNHRLTFKIKSLEASQKRMVECTAVCHTFFIVKDKGMQIDWKNPLVQKSQINCRVSLALSPFSEGAMRYAFYMKDLDIEQELVAKMPKNVDPATYTLEVMQKDIEAMFLCSHVVNEFNDLIIAYGETRLLVEFVHAFIYELTTENVRLPLFYGENFISGKYEKYNNNAGWKAGKDSKQALIAQTLSHFSWQLTSGYMMIVDLQGVNNVLTDP